MANIIRTGATRVAIFDYSARVAIIDYASSAAFAAGCRAQGIMDERGVNSTQIEPLEEGGYLATNPSWADLLAQAVARRPVRRT